MPPPFPCALGGTLIAPQFATTDHARTRRVRQLRALAAAPACCYTRKNGAHGVALSLDVPAQAPIAEGRGWV